MPIGKRKDGSGKYNNGRPTKYKPEYCKMIVDFFSKPYYEMQSQMKSYNDKTGSEKEYTKPFPIDFPTIEKFSNMIDVDDDTIVERCKVHKDFSAAYKKAIRFAKDILIVNGLNGLYKEGFAKFVGINYFPELKDKSEIDTKHSGEIAIKEQIDDEQSKRIAERLLNKKS